MIIFRYSLVFASFALAVFSLSACTTNQQAGSGAAQAQPPNVVSVPIDTARLLKMKTEKIDVGSVTKNLHVTGIIRPDVAKEVNVNPRFTGRVAKTFVSLGQHVSNGTVLATVDSCEIAELQAQYLKARAELASARAQEERERQIYEENVQRPMALINAKAEYSKTKVRLQLAEADLNRVNKLFKERIAAEKDLLATKARCEQETAAYSAAENEMQRQQRFFNNKALLKRDLTLASVQTAQARNLADTLRQRLLLLGVPEATLKKLESTGQIVSENPITASSAGVITAQNFAVGEIVSPNKTLFVITDLSTVVALADIPEVDLRYVSMGAPALVTVAAYPEHSFEGKISFISERIKRETGTVPIRVRLDNTNLRLKADMFAKMTLPSSEYKVLLCPRDAIQDHNGKRVVFVKTAAGYMERAVEFGKEFKDAVEVLQGLSRGDEVATDGSLLLKTAMAAPKNTGHD